MGRDQTDAGGCKRSLPFTTFSRLVNQMYSSPNGAEAFGVLKMMSVKQWVR